MEEIFKFITLYNWQVVVSVFSTCFIIGFIIKPVARKLIKNKGYRHLLYLGVNLVLSFGISAITGLIVGFDLVLWWQFGLSTYMLLGVGYKIYETVGLKCLFEKIAGVKKEEIILDEIFEKQIFNLLNEKKLKNNLTMFVETPKNSKNKYEKVGNNWLKRKVNKRFLFNYGFIPNTISGDGDELDCVLIGRRQIRGKVLNVRPIGMFVEVDNGFLDSKIITIAVTKKEKKPSSLERTIKKYIKMSNTFKKGVELNKLVGQAEAVQHINSCILKDKKEIKKEKDKKMFKWLNANKFSIIIGLFVGAVFGFAGYLTIQTYFATIIVGWLVFLACGGAGLIAFLLTFWLGHESLLTFATRVNAKKLGNEEFQKVLDKTNELVKELESKDKLEKEKKEKAKKLAAAQKKVAEYEEAKKLLEENKKSA